MLKRCLTYLRYSSDGQSNSSIERQEIITENWYRNNSIENCDTFKDEGYSARTFDRPDIKKLFSFISTARNIHYLVVSDLTRFSRELGDAVNMVKKIQQTYNIKIVSASRNCIYDVHDPTSFFMMSLEFLIGNTENLKRMADINSGIYAAKKKEGRYLGMAPIGYKNIRLDNNKPGIAPDEVMAPVVRFIFNAFLQGMPIKNIRLEAAKIGFRQTSNSAIPKILSNKVYIGMVHVKSYKDFPEEWVQGIHIPIVDRKTFDAVQQKLTRKNPVQIINDKLPLRGVLKCWCQKPLTGAPSKGRHGGLYYYYKCNTSSQHNNISAIAAHKQLQEIFNYLSLTQRLVISIKSKMEGLLNDRLKENKKLIISKSALLKKVQADLESMEQKYISNQIEFDTYQRWYTSLSQQRIMLQQDLQSLRSDENEICFLMETELDKLMDLNYIYNSANTTEKQQFIRLGFDNRLYYANKVYRTPYIMPSLAHNALILKEKNLLILDEEDKIFSLFRSGGAEQNPIEPLYNFLSFIQTIKTA